MDRSVIEAKCVQVGKANAADPERSKFFVGLTADEHGKGHALCEVKPNGEIVKHWGDADAYQQILADA